MAWTNKQSKSQFPARTPQVQGRHCTGHFYHPGITSIPEEPNTPDMASSIERSSSRSSSIWSSSTGNTSEQQKSTLDVMSKIKPRPFRSPGTHVVRYKSGASTNSNRKNSTTSSRWLTLRRNLAQARELREAEDSAEDAASTASYQEKRTSWERLEEDEHRAQLKTHRLIRARERRARSRDSVSIRSISS